jgi:hypothetical protein
MGVCAIFMLAISLRSVFWLGAAVFARFRSVLARLERLLGVIRIPCVVLYRFSRLYSNNLAVLKANFRFANGTLELLVFTGRVHVLCSMAVTSIPRIR